jgi:CheY-like chemotaxis protein
MMENNQRAFTSVGKKKILVVDDDPTTLKMLEGILGAAGYDVVRASAGQDAIDLAREQKPDLLVLDIELPGMDGINVAFKLRELPETKNIPIVFLSALMGKEIERETSATPRSSFLRKPVIKDVLLGELKKYF